MSEVVSRKLDRREHGETALNQCTCLDQCLDLSSESVSPIHEQNNNKNYIFITYQNTVGDT